MQISFKHVARFKHHPTYPHIFTIDKQCFTEFDNLSLTFDLAKVPSVTCAIRVVPFFGASSFSQDHTASIVIVVVKVTRISRFSGIPATKHIGGTPFEHPAAGDEHFPAPMASPGPLART